MVSFELCKHAILKNTNSSGSDRSRSLTLCRWYGVPLNNNLNVVLLEHVIHNMVELQSKFLDGNILYRSSKWLNDILSIEIVIRLLTSH